MLDLILEGAGALAEAAVDAAGEVVGEAVGGIAEVVGAAGEAIGGALEGAAAADDGMHAIWIAGDIIGSGLSSEDEPDEIHGRPTRSSAAEAAPVPEATGESESGASGSQEAMFGENNSAAKMLQAQEHGLDEMFDSTEDTFDKEEKPFG